MQQCCRERLAHDTHVVYNLKNSISKEVVCNDNNTCMFIDGPSIVLCPFPCDVLVGQEVLLEKEKE